MFSNVKAARILGWTSIAVGVTEIAATHWLEEQMGLDESHPALIRGFGAREIAAGVTLLQQPGLNKTLAAGLWARVAGDAMDIAALAAASKTTDRPTGLAVIKAIVYAITGIDIFVAARVQYDLAKATTVSKAARQRVRPTNAIPKKSGNGTAPAQGRLAGMTQ